MRRFGVRTGGIVSDKRLSVIAGCVMRSIAWAECIKLLNEFISDGFVPNNEMGTVDRKRYGTAFYHGRFVYSVFDLTTTVG